MSTILPDLVDTALEVSILGSFSRLGYLARRRLYRWRDPGPDGLRGHTVLVTGPTSGLGLATAKALAGLGARVLLVGRNQARLDQLAAELAARAGEDRFPTVLADMSSIESVREAVAQITATESRLDVVVDSAGAIHAERELTDDGLEATFATMVVGPFVMIDGLLPMLTSARGRVISVVSGGMYGQALPLDDLQFERGEYNGTLAYARAKRAATAMMREWHRRRRDSGVRFNAMHPGWADTPGLAESLPSFYGLMRPLLRSPGEGIDTTVWLASEDDAGRDGGQLYLDRRPRPFDRLRRTRLSAAQRAHLWDRVVALSGQPVSTERASGG